MDLFFNLKLNSIGIFWFFLAVIAVVYLVWNRWDNYVQPASEQVTGHSRARWWHAFKPLAYLVLVVIFIAGIIAIVAFVHDGLTIGHGNGSVETPVPTSVPTPVPVVPAPSTAAPSAEITSQDFLSVVNTTSQVISVSDQFGIKRADNIGPGVTAQLPCKGNTIDYTFTGSSGFNKEVHRVFQPNEKKEVILKDDHLPKTSVHA
jgi:hypothetical protein